MSVASQGNSLSFAKFKTCQSLFFLNVNSRSSCIDISTRLLGSKLVLIKDLYFARSFGGSRMLLQVVPQSIFSVLILLRNKFFRTTKCLEIKHRVDRTRLLFRWSKLYIQTINRPFFCPFVNILSDRKLIRYIRDFVLNKSFFHSIIYFSSTIIIDIKRISFEHL